MYFVYSRMLNYCRSGGRSIAWHEYSQHRQANPAFRQGFSKAQDRKWRCLGRLIQLCCQRNAGAIFNAANQRGPFQGTIAPQTPNQALSTCR